MIGLLRTTISDKVIKFVITGGINTVISYLCFVFFVFAGINYLLASTLGYSIALLNSYLLNKHWTFKSKKKTTSILFSQFVLINLLSLGINLFMLFLLFNKFSVDLYLSQAIAIMFSMVFNYIGYRWIFRAV